MDLNDKVCTIEKEVVKLTGKVEQVERKVDNAESDIKSVNKLCNQLEKFIIEIQISNKNKNKILEEIKSDKKKLNWYFFTSFASLIITAIWLLIVK